MLDTFGLQVGIRVSGFGVQGSGKAGSLALACSKPSPLELSEP